MTLMDDIYAAVDDFGLITPAEAEQAGIAGIALVQLARRGRLERVSRGVYRVPAWPYQEAFPYALAVRSVGAEAYLCGESVVALLGLAPTDPRCVHVASPKRVRRELPGGVVAHGMRTPARTAYYEGVPCQYVAEAIIEAAMSIGVERAMRAARAAFDEGYLTREEWEKTLGRLK